MIVCFPLFFVSPYRFKTESGEFRTGRKVEIFTRLANSLRRIQEKIIKVQFSSECKVREFANCSKNQNKVLKCIFKSNWVLGFAKYWDFARKNFPTGGEIQELWNAQLAKAPYQPWGPPPPPTRGSRYQVHKFKCHYLDIMNFCI